MKKEEKIYTLWFYSSLYFPIYFSILLFLYGLLKEGNLQIFKDFWWIIILVWIIFSLVESHSRYIKINYISKKVIIKDGILNKLTMNEGEVKEIKLNYPSKIFYVQNGIEKIYKNPFLMIRSKDKKKIIEALLEFNSELRVTN